MLLCGEQKSHRCSHYYSIFSGGVSHMWIYHLTRFAKKSNPSLLLGQVALELFLVLSCPCLSLPFQWFSWQITYTIPCPSGKWEWNVTCQPRRRTYLSQMTRWHFFLVLHQLWRLYNIQNFGKKWSDLQKDTFPLRSFTPKCLLAAFKTTICEQKQSWMMKVLSYSS